MPEKQLLHLVIGGELEDLEHNTFRDLTKIDLVGASASHGEAVAAWRRKAQETVDNALMRYDVIHAHKLLDPGKEGEAG